MKSQYIVLIVMIWISSSCEKQEELSFQRDAEGVITSMPYQWKTSLSEDGNLISGFIHSSVTYQGNALFAAQKKGKDGSTLVMLSGKNGEVLWEFDDFYEQHKKFFSIRDLYQPEENLIFQEGKQFYHLNLVSGSTVHKANKDYRIARMSGLKNQYFIAGNFISNQDELFDGGVFSGDISYSQTDMLFKPEFNRSFPGASNEIGVVGSVEAFQEEIGDIILTYDYSTRNANAVDTYAGLYNYTKAEHIYDKQPLALGIDSYGSGKPVIYDNKIYYSPGRTIVCLDLYTGDQVWKKEFDQGFTFSGFILADDKIIANNEDTYLYALDPNTGSQLWKTKSSGTSSRMTHMNGVVYFTGGGDGLLHAVEIETGKHLWRIRSPDLTINRGAWFKDVVRVVPSNQNGNKGKVMVSSYLSAFCYEAAR
ncbi:MAG: PQQ-binding-like beta-propeller repeat protein [Cyclobacteriaceae bacterium]